MPADNSEAGDAAQRNGFVTRYNYVGTGQGTVVRITEFAPGAPKFMHRTETVDYALLLSGECDLELDSGEVAHLKPGDVVVQRGTMHAWVNNGTAPCVFAFILIDAEPATVAGQELRTHFPAPRAGQFSDLRSREPRELRSNSQGGRSGSAARHSFSRPARRVTPGFTWGSPALRLPKSREVPGRV
jgi:quercetin dioxygenase-like cupin family protein